MFEADSLLDELKEALAERAFNTQRDHHHLADEEAGTTRNGYGRLPVVIRMVRNELTISHDRQATSNP